MAPPKIIDQNIVTHKLLPGKPNIIGTKMTTRNSGRTAAAASMLKKMNLKDLSKRKADQLSPPKGKTTKRSAFYDITNAGNANNLVANEAAKKATNVVKKAVTKTTVTVQPKQPVLTKIAKPKISTVNDENADPNVPKAKPAATKKVSSVELKPKEKEVLKKEVPQREKRSKGKQINETKEKEILVEVTEVKEIKTEVTLSSEVTVCRKSLSEESSLYSTALETISPDESLFIISPIKKEKIKLRTPGPPHGVIDFDKENRDDPCQVSNYAMDVFKYLKLQEQKFAVGDYMSKQTLISCWMRSLLVDWMVDVQEHFELNHETLYLAVKVVDLYLDKREVPKETLQLIGAAALFIASKYDERIPPAIDDFLHVCENIYTREELIKMEMELFREMDFCLGMPLSYRFLRRFARCCKTSMPILTLARYILELSLMEYSIVSESESKLAAAALYLALRMKGASDWSPTLEYYSGYKLDDFRSLALQLNSMLHKKPKEQLRTVRTKYSHTIFFEVAKTPLIESDTL